ncbi:hypothetical protein ACNI65_18965 [Roseateles sp. So40a]|uniref:hypothetical protein n=1 Tax=Roseateles sp. So40a TaxID=3400226 RepID=UPI003A8588BE
MSDDNGGGSTAQLLTASVGMPESRADGRALRIKDLGLFAVSILILMALVGVSLLILVDPCGVEENRQWALSTLTAVFGGILGWLIKR